MLIIPDVHGRAFWEKPVHENLGKEHILFLGDYLDPYGYEGIPSGEVFPRFEAILALKKEHPDSVTLLLGNHDLHYVDRRLQGSRYDHLHGARNQKAFLENADLFQIAYETEVAGKNYLFTHAGVLQGWLLAHRYLLGTIQAHEVGTQLNAFWRDETLRPNLLKALGDIPHSRGGDSPYGSPVWADVDDWQDATFELPGLYQIFGHSQQLTGPIIVRHFACLDCRRAFRLGESEQKTVYLKAQHEN